MKCPIAQLPYPEFQEWFHQQSIRQRQITRVEDITWDLFHHMTCEECARRMLECK